MKQITKALAFAVLAATALVSCKKELEEPVFSPSEGIKLTITAGAPVTKTYVEGVTPFWKSTDAIGVFTYSDETNVKFTNTLPDGKKGVFTGKVPAVGKYYAYYPYSDQGANDTGALVKIPETQHPTPTSFDGAADILVSEGFDVESAETQNLDKLLFTRLGAFLKFSFIDGTTGGILSGEYVKEVKLIVNLNVDGTYRPCPSVRITPDGLANFGGGMKTIYAKYDDNVYELTAAGQAAWFGIRPNTFAAGNTFDLTITTSNHTLVKTLTLPSEVAVGAGQVLPVNVTFTDADFPLTVTKLWDRRSDSGSNYMQDFGGTASTDFNIAVDDKNVYVAEFGGSKKIWAIDIASSTSSLLKATAVDNSAIKSEGFDGSIYLSCARVIKKNDGTPVLLVSNLSTGSYGWLYAYENGINAAPKVIKLDQYGAGRRLGDTFSVYGTYEKAMLIFATHAAGANGFVTFQLPAYEKEGVWTSGLWNRYAITLNANFEGYWPFPGDLTRGVFGKRIAGGDGYRSLYMSIDTSSKDDAASGKVGEKTLWAESSAAFPATTEKLEYLNEDQNFNGVAYNYHEFNGKRYIIYGSNTAYSGAAHKLIVKCGDITTDWKDILNTNAVFFSESLTGSVTTGWKGALDVQTFQTDDAIYIAVNKMSTGIAVYKLSR